MNGTITHDDLVILTEWMARHDFSADDLAYAVAKPWKFADFLELAPEGRGPEDD